MIHHLSPRRKRWGPVVLGALAAAVLGTPLIAATATNPAAGAEPTNPAIELVAPEKVTAYTYGGGIYSDLGFRLEVEDAPLEIWSQRAADYESLPTAVAKLPLGDVTLPAQEQIGRAQALHQAPHRRSQQPRRRPGRAIPQHLPRRDG